MRAGFKDIVMRTLCFVLFSLVATISHGQVISTIAGTGVSGFSGEGGLAIHARFAHPVGVTSDKTGNIYIADRENNVIQKIDIHGVLTRFAGNGFSGNNGDGGPATAASLSLGLEVGMVTDSAGYVYISSGGQVRKVSPSGIISTVAGNGSYGYSGDGGPATAAQLKAPTGLCFDKAGNLYIADEQSHTVRVVNTSGIISTIAGTGIAGFSGDGGLATNAQLTTPIGIAVDDLSNLYIAAVDNHRVRKVNTAGVMTTIAGIGIDPGPKFCNGCIATSLQLSGPLGLAVDGLGNVYVAVIGNDAVYKITPDGKAYTIAGTGDEGFSGDGGPATAAEIKHPKMICLDNQGNLLITDKGNIRYRKVWLGTTYIPYIPHGAAHLSVYPSLAVGGSFTCYLQSDTNESAHLFITNTLGRVVYTTACTTNVDVPLSLPFPSGMYFISATTASGLKTLAKVVVQ